MTGNPLVCAEQQEGQDIACTCEATGRLQVETCRKDQIRHTIPLIDLIVLSELHESHTPRSKSELEKIPHDSPCIL
jgi:hypothetical protein